jgi:AcrR family transcriptional regulator
MTQLSPPNRKGTKTDYLVIFILSGSMAVISQPARAAKREAILAAAVAQFALHGYADTEMGAIGQAAGVAKGTLYLYFKSKEELFLAAVDHALQRLVEFVFESIVCLDDPVAIVRTSFRAIARFCAKNPEVIELMAAERAAFRDRKPPRHLFHRDKNSPFFAEIIRRGMAQGAFRQVDPDLVVQTCGALIQGLILGARREGNLDQLVDRAEESLDLLLRGLLPSS